MKMKAILGLASGLFAACSANQPAGQMASSSELCQISDLAAVFADPGTFDGKQFCGYATLVSEHVFSFYPSIPQSDEDRYGIVLLPKGPEAELRQLGRMGTHKVLRVKGTIKVDRDCLSGHSLCTPFRRPITLDNFSFEKPGQAKSDSN